MLADGGATTSKVISAWSQALNQTGLFAEKESGDGVFNCAQLTGLARDISRAGAVLIVPLGAVGVPP